MMLNLIILPFVLGLLQYRIVAQQAICTVAGYSWMYNSLKQDPCVIASRLGRVCHGAIWTMDPLPPGTHYGGLDPAYGPPSPCECNTVSYSIMAACSLCQDRGYIRFSSWTDMCTIVYSQKFPKDIPYDTAVPHYAYLDVQADDFFDVRIAQTAGGPESTSPPKSTPPSTAATTTSTPTQSNSTAKKTNVRAIAGGVGGGIAGLAILGVLVFVLLRHRPAPRDKNVVLISDVPAPA